MAQNSKPKTFKWLNIQAPEDARSASYSHTLRSHIARNYTYVNQPNRFRDPDALQPRIEGQETPIRSAGAETGLPPTTRARDDAARNLNQKAINRLGSGLNFSGEASSAPRSQDSPRRVRRISKDEAHVTSLSREHTPLLPSPRAPYERMRSEYDFDIIQLSALTTLPLGRSLIRLLSSEPNHLIRLLRQHRWSYLSYLPSRFGHRHCLDAAIRCLSSRFRQWMSTPYTPPDAKVISLHLHAIKALQAELDDPAARLHADVLCSVELLAMYELLNTSNNQAWEFHTSGATTLVKMRGANGFETDYDIALLLARVPTMFTEAILNGQKSCFEEKKWSDVLRSAISENVQFGDRSEILISLWMTLAFVPGLLRDVSVYMRSIEQEIPADNVDLMRRARSLRQGLLDWRAKYYKLLQTIDDETMLDPTVAEMRFAVNNGYLANMMIASRFIVILDPKRGAPFEREAQSAADEWASIKEQTPVTQTRESLFMALKAAVANATIATKEEWREITRENRIVDVFRSDQLANQAWRHWIELTGFP